MPGYKMRFITASALILLLSGRGGVVCAKTWHLEQGRDWKPVEAQGKGKYLLAVAQIKKLVSTGQSEAVRKALEQLKKDFPEIAGPDLDAFIEAELLFCDGAFTKATRSYDKFLAEFSESKLYEAALDRQFSIGTAFLAGQKRPVLGVFKITGYAAGERIMERISDRAGDSPIGIKAVVAVAKSLERRRRFNEAYHKWSEISSRWPSGQTGKEALLSMARCKHAAYRGPKFDVSNLISARSYYENFKLRYPKESEEINVDEKIKLINEQSAYKQLDIGRYYERTGSKQSANFYYQMVLDNWPKSTAAKMVRKARSEKPGSEEIKK